MFDVISLTNPNKMKQLFLSIATVCIALTASAQIEKGTWVLGANTNLGYNSYTPTSGGKSVNILNIGLKSGYFVSDNFTIGANLEYLSESSGGPSNTYTTIGLFLRYYTKNVFFGAGYNSLSTSGGGSSLGSIPIEVGYAAFLTRNITIEPALVYSSATDSDNGGMPGIAGLPFPAKSGFGLKVGFSIYLGRPAE